MSPLSPHVTTFHFIAPHLTVQTSGTRSVRPGCRVDLPGADPATPRLPPRPLYVSTASQIGILPTRGVPSLPHRLLPDNAGLSVCLAYLRSLLLSPPPPHVATSIQDACRRMYHLPVLPEFLCVPPSRLVKLISAEETTSTELLRVRALATNLPGNAAGCGVVREGGLRQLALDLLVPTQFVCGLPLHVDTLARDCETICAMVSNVLLDDTARLMDPPAPASAPAAGLVEGAQGEEEEEEEEELNGEVARRISGMQQQQQQFGVVGAKGGAAGWKAEEEGEDGGDRGLAISGSEFEAMEDFFEEMEARWRGRVRYEHIQAECEKVARAAERYNEVVSCGGSVFRALLHFPFPLLPLSLQLPPLVIFPLSRFPFLLSLHTSVLSSSSFPVATLFHNLLLSAPPPLFLFSLSFPASPHAPPTPGEAGSDAVCQPQSQPLPTLFLFPYCFPLRPIPLPPPLHHTRQVKQDLMPFVIRSRSLSPRTSFAAAKKVEIAAYRDYGVLLKGTRAKALVSAQDPSDPLQALVQKLVPASVDSKGKKVGDGWYSTHDVDEALSDSSQVKMAGDCWGSCFVLHPFIPLTTFEAPQKGSCFVLHPFIPLTKLFPVPYWLDNTPASPAVPNTVALSSLALLTGPNGGGKSSLLRSVCAAALLASCGLMVPCVGSAHVPRFDAIVLRMMPADSPSDAKSSFQFPTPNPINPCLQSPVPSRVPPFAPFSPPPLLPQMEMMELRSITQDASPRSLVLLDELCKGTEPDKGACLVASALEFLDQSRCVGVLSTHFHRVLDLPLQLHGVVRLSMGTRRRPGDGGMEPTWRVTQGECRVTGSGSGNGAAVAAPASVPIQAVGGGAGGGMHEIGGVTRARAFMAISDAVRMFENATAEAVAMQDAGLAQEQGPLLGINGGSSTEVTGGEKGQSLLAAAGGGGDGVAREGVRAVVVMGMYMPSASVANYQSFLYLVCRPDGRFYVGETDEITLRIQTHRKKYASTPIAIIPVLNKSEGRFIETHVIKRLRDAGVPLWNQADQYHKHFGSSGAPPPPPLLPPALLRRKKGGVEQGSGGQGDTHCVPDTRFGGWVAGGWVVV
ncbi:unnamed protein product [Closterium sp. Yama58-4]|nr:unnamed protein product [Closterium sp. Yama58-4]